MAQYNRNQGNRRNQSDKLTFSKSDYSKLLALHKQSDNNLIDNIKKYIEERYRDITTSQLRNIFSEIKKASLAEIPLKRPKLAYIAGRTDARKRGMHDLLELLDELIQGIKTEEDVKGFKAFFEAILAYHKYYEKVGNRRSGK